VTGDVLKRFVTKFTVNPETGCWDWTAASRSDGYGAINTPGRTELAHRVSFTVFVGPIPEDLQIDHLCNNRGCVNPDHLEPVSQVENLGRGARRRTRCRQGHLFTLENTGYKATGYRFCRQCSRRQSREAQHRKQARDRAIALGGEIPAWAALRS